MSKRHDTLNDRYNLLTIIETCEKIMRYVDGMSREEFFQNECVVDACAINGLVIGERAAELSYEFTRNYNGIPWANMESFRQLPAHLGADSFDVRVLCDTVFIDIPETLDYCREVLKDYDSKGGMIRSLNRRRLFRRKGVEFLVVIGGVFGIAFGTVGVGAHGGMYVAIRFNDFSDFGNNYYFGFGKVDGILRF